MKRTNLTVLSDTVFAFLGIGLSCLCILRYYGLSLFPALLSAALFAFSLSFPFFLFLSKKRDTTLLKKREQAEKEKLMLHFALTPEREILSLWQRANQLPAGEAFARFTMQPLSADEILSLARKHPDRSVLLLTNVLTKEAAALAEKLGVTVVEGTQVYLTLKKEGLLPEKYRLELDKKRTPRERAEGYFAKGNSRSFFLCGVGLLLFSFLTPFPVYYVITGSVLVTLSLVVKWFRYKSG